MTIATALITGNDPHPQLAEDAVAQALSKAGLTHASAVLLFLTPEFSRHTQEAVTAAARRAQCMQVAGGIASGVLTETGWVLDRPAAAAMVFGSEFPLTQGEAGGTPMFSYAGSAFPTEWTDAGPRFGGLFSNSFSGSSAHGEPAVWQQGRLSATQRCSLSLPGAEIAIGVSTGLRLLGEAQPIERSNGFDLERLGGQPAARSLLRALPAELRGELGNTPDHHLHHLAAVVFDAAPSGPELLNSQTFRTVALIGTNADQTVTLMEHARAGQYLAWAIRQPLSAETDMRQTVDRLKVAHPACALMFSCIGRGPFFYGGEDRDLNILRERFPNLPILGTYGTGQVAPLNPPGSVSNIELQNSVVVSIIGKKPTTTHTAPG